MKIVKPFFYGILASFGALLLEIIIKNFSGNDSSLVDISTRLSWFLVLAVSIEELFKILLIHKYYQELQLFSGLLHNLPLRSKSLSYQ